MNIGFITSELAPVAKVGGLADVAASLPRALTRLGHRVFVVTPGYGFVERDAHGIRPTGVHFEIEMDGALRRGSVSRARIHGIATFFIENEDYFARRAVYGEVGRDYADNAYRFAFFTRAVPRVMRALDLEPDVYHVHDWQTALLSYYQRLDEPRGSTAPVVLTVHNLAYQGVFPRASLPRLGLPEELFRVDALEFYGQVNFLKGGLQSADWITTVSPSYAREIQTDRLGAGLDGVIRTRSDRLTGILNGIEPADWQPEHDGALAAPFAPDRLEGKALNKASVQRELGLAPAPSIPLLAILGRLDPQKGFDLLLEAIPSLLGEGRAQLAVLGSGRQELIEAFKRLEPRYPGALSANTGFRDELGRRIYAGADLFLMPSRYEPCGLGQMIALRYGTLPVVRSTGGLSDTIRDLDFDPETGNGFSFEELSVSALVDAVERALRHYRDGERWKRWVQRAMRQDFSWGPSAARYVEVYRNASRS